MKKFLISIDGSNTDILRHGEGDLSFAQAKRECIEDLKYIIRDCKLQIKKVRSYKMKDFKEDEK